MRHHRESRTNLRRRRTNGDPGPAGGGVQLAVASRVEGVDVRTDEHVADDAPRTSTVQRPRDPAPTRAGQEHAGSRFAQREVARWTADERPWQFIVVGKLSNRRDELGTHARGTSTCVISTRPIGWGMGEADAAAS